MRRVNVRAEVSRCVEMAEAWKEDLARLQASSPKSSSSPEKWREDLTSLKASSPELHAKLAAGKTDLDIAEAELHVLQTNDLSNNETAEAK